MSYDLYFIVLQVGKFSPRGVDRVGPCDTSAVGRRPKQYGVIRAGSYGS